MSETDLGKVTTSSEHIWKPRRRRGRASRWTAWVLDTNNLPLVIGAVVVGIFTLAALFAGQLSPYGADEKSILLRLKPPAWLEGGTWAHPLGTDELGRDVLTRLMYGARVSLLVGVLSVALSGPVGMAIGLLAGYYGRWIDNVLMRITDMQLAIPTVLFAIAVVAVLGPGVRNVVITLAITGWTAYARVVRGETLSVREREFVTAAKVLGAGQGRMMMRHILPNVFSSSIVIATFSVANMIILEATLSFLGLGVEPATATWGSMLNTGRTYMQTSWWLTTFPGVAIFLTVLGVNLMGDHLRDVLDPTLRHRGK
jgi:peptide/nickel transport system permease protein